MAARSDEFDNRWVALAAGGAVAIGAALLYRELTTRGDTRRRLSGAKGTLVEESVTINRPVADVFRFWRNFENLPTFMRHLESVSMRDAGLSHWVAKGPAGSTVEWDARIINEIDNRLIAWQSVPPSTIATAGSVAFDETPHGTRVRVRFQYSPPAGRLGAAIAYVFGEEPRLQVYEDLRRFKQLLETGEIATTDGQPSGRASVRARGAGSARAGSARAGSDRAGSGRSRRGDTRRGRVAGSPYDTTTEGAHR